MTVAMNLFSKALLCLLFLGSSVAAQADIVKPALIEINVYKSGVVDIVIRASIEAMVTGINSQFKNTRDSPMAKEYDALRILSAEDLSAVFDAFDEKLLDNVWANVANRRLNLKIKSVDIPPPGYVKVPRISKVTLTGSLDKQGPVLQWYYPALFGDSAVRLRQIDLQQKKWHWSSWDWIRDDRPSKRFSLTEVVVSQSTPDLVWTYLTLGFLHILPKGTDHILFVLGMLFFSRKLRPVLLQVTMFTLAHTLSLGLSSKGVITLPPSVFEPLIALSIAYIGIENLFLRFLAPHRLVLVFLFGLIHGLGFASVLEEFGLPKDDFLIALLGFNIGVEAGQLAICVICLSLFAIIGWCVANASVIQKRIEVIGSIFISVVGLYWFWQRLVI